MTIKRVSSIIALGNSWVVVIPIDLAKSWIEEGHTVLECEYDGGSVTYHPISTPGLLEARA